MDDYKAEKLVKMSILINEEPVDALSIADFMQIGHLIEAGQCVKA